MIHALRELLSALPRLAASQRRADEVAVSLQAVASRLAPPGSTRSDLLNGTWLGHPLHPVLTDVPIGFWTSAAVLDLAGGAGMEGADKAADLCVGLGLAGAVGTAASGIADWQHAQGATRRIGVVHACMNVAATLLYGLSLLLRLRGKRGSGRLTAIAAMGAATAGAYLGGTLVFGERMGTDHASDEGVPEEFERVASLAELPEGRPWGVRTGTVDAVLVRERDDVFALTNVCAHLGGPLDEGEVDGCTIICPWHGSTFALDTGEALTGPTAFDQPRLEVRVRDGQVELRRAR